MNKTKIKVTLEYIGGFTRQHSHDYRVMKIVGAPTIEVENNGKFDTTRVGNVITEKQATGLADRVEVTTLRKP